MSASWAESLEIPETIIGSAVMPDEGADTQFGTPSAAGRNQFDPYKPTFYVASRASNVERPRMWVDMRDRLGYRILSTWIDLALLGEEVPFDLLWSRITAEVACCDCLVLYVDAADFPLSGAFVEVGMALALNKPVRVVVSGFELNKIDCKPLGSWARHPLVKFAPTVEEALASFVKSRDNTAASFAAMRALGLAQIA